VKNSWLDGSKPGPIASFDGYSYCHVVAGNFNSWLGGLWAESGSFLGIGSEHGAGFDI
jgi:hypothetical protein